MITKDLGVVTAYGYAVSKGYTGTEEEFAELMASYATVAESAAQSAQTATEKAQAAAQAVLDAVAAKDAAVQAKNDAVDAKDAAAQSATNAASSATAASGSATNASQSAQAASDSASAAAQSATNASGSATAANTAKEAAVSAKGAAETAQGKAETAQSKAEEAQGKAEEAAESINPDTLAKINGYYQDMTVGEAEQLLATVGNEDSVPYNFRTSGGSIDIGDRETDMVVGGTVCWNQLLFGGEASGCTVTSANGIITITPTTSSNRYIATNANNSTTTRVVDGHKYLQSVVIKSDGEHYVGFQNYRLLPFDKKTTSASFVSLSVVGQAQSSGLATIQLYSPSSTEYQIKEGSFILIDLTKMFGSTIADYIYNLETANEGDGVAFFRKLFPKDYYEYNTGELMSVKTSAHKMVGFNAWDEEWELGYYNNIGNASVSSENIRSKNFIPVLPNTKYYFKTRGTTMYICQYDENKTFIGGRLGIADGSYTTTSKTRYIRFNLGSGYGNTYKNDICINLSWDGERDGEYEEYVEHVYPLDSSLELRGIPKLDASNNLYYDGDTYESDGTVTRRYGVVDLGSLAWVLNATNEFAASVVGAKGAAYAGVANAVCENYLLDKYNNVHGHSTDKTAAVLTNSYLYVYDTSYTDATAFKTAMSGVYLVYELAEPTTETAEPYQNPQVVNDFGTEEYVDERAVPIPVGHQTKYLANLRAKLEMSPDSPSADGEYIVKQTNGKNEYIALGSSTTMQSIMAKLPNPPSEDGTYTLKVTVANGTATYSWGA